MKLPLGAAPRKLEARYRSFGACLAARLQAVALRIQNRVAGASPRAGRCGLNPACWAAVPPSQGAAVVWATPGLRVDWQHRRPRGPACQPGVVRLWREVRRHQAAIVAREAPS